MVEGSPEPYEQARRNSHDALEYVRKILQKKKRKRIEQEIKERDHLEDVDFTIP